MTLPSTKISASTATSGRQRYDRPGRFRAAAGQQQSITQVRVWEASKGQMPFHTELNQAIDEGSIERVRDLLAAGCDPNGLDAFGQSPLAVAAMCNSLDCLELLVGRGADIKLANAEGWTALHFAVDHAIDSAIQGGGRPGEERTEAIEWLVRNGANPDARAADGASPVDIAREYRSDRVLTKLGQ